MSYRGAPRGRSGGFGGGRGGGFSSRGGRGGYQQSYGPPATVMEMGSFVHACEGEMVCESVNTKIPYFNAPIYLENKTAIGKVDEVLGPINQLFFTIKPQEGIVATSFKSGDKFFIGGDKLLPLEKSGLDASRNSYRNLNRRLGHPNRSVLEVQREEVPCAGLEAAEEVWVAARLEVEEGLEIGAVEVPAEAEVGEVASALVGADAVAIRTSRGLGVFEVEVHDNTWGQGALRCCTEAQAQIVGRVVLLPAILPIIEDTIKHRSCVMQVATAQHRQST
ncbi:H/ACA snoRNP pseudouridylase subunit [Loxospora ochrophaea]|nr:H/ACA snoRNP pseudouridylase subunit [Loxospora ochrophaea]